ncbi:ATP-binding protein [Streptomyces hainanensis]|uniref:ATP-binding protein n=1 Tax=Streptomyces hainanensis TaxID=402648 RepID=A0A4R4TGL3_9ACTN|nr:ATP-binding protein [Streptomyces hainanensis]TDC74093.1 ATP-binding protein [Streptomyces hainanensis]
MIQPIRSYWLTAPNAVDTAKLARDHVVRLLDHTGHGALADNAQLLTSEIVTNVFSHTDVPFVTVETVIDARRVLVATYDESERHPMARRADDAASANENGRGLLLVELLAADWGVAASPLGKRVWFELS